MDLLVPSLAEQKFRFFQDDEQMCVLVPEWRALYYTCEMNGWHYGESTKEHTLQVIKNALALLRRPKFSRLRAHLENTAIDGRSLLELFLWANVLHDIAKPYTQEIKLERLVDPVLYPGHEAKGAEMVPDILGRLNFTAEQIAWVTYIVRWHGDMHGFFGKPEEDFQQKQAEWEASHGPYLRYLYLHSWADTIGAKLEERDPVQYDLRLHRYGLLLTDLGG